MKRSSALVILALLLSGCPSKSRRARSPSTLTLHAEVEPAHLVNMIQPDAWAHRITSHNLFESLIRMNPKTYTFQGELASTWQVSKDHLTYTFYLRPGVKWHDGKPFSGNDVKFTFDRLMDERVRAASARATLAPFIASYKLIKPDQFQIVCKRTSRWFLVSISDLAILPAHLMGEGDLNTHPLLREPVGTGPYRFVAWKSGRRITLRRFDSYWGKRPRIEKLIYRFVRDPDMAVRMARRGELDFLSRVRAAQWTNQVRTDPVFRHEFLTLRHHPPGVFYILLNHKREPLSDRRVRRALAMLLDLDTVVDKVMHGLARRVGALYWFLDPDHDKTLKPVAFDPQGAEKLLAQAGFADSDDNGVLDRGGKPLRFTFLLVASSKTNKRWLTLYQAALRKAGIVMDINPIDWATYLQRMRNHDFDAGALGMIQTGPFSDLYYQFHSSQIEDGQNYGAYSNEQVDRRLEQIRETMDPEARRRISLQLQRILYDDMAVIPLFSTEDPGIVSRRVHGVYSSALWYQVRDWWIE
jgi:peptide/nickel transport system substrate-binding protein